MISYGDAINWCISNGAVMRFTERSKRPEFILVNQDIPGDKALELAVDIMGKTHAVHCPLRLGIEPSKAIASALISCVEFFLNKQSLKVRLN
jgi:hypothetical protein